MSSSIWALGFVSLLMDVSSEMIHALLPVYMVTVMGTSALTVGLIDGTFRANLEETGMGYGHEIDMIRMARAKDMLTTPYVFGADDAAEMAKAGADIIVAHLGLTTGGSIGAETSLKLQDCPKLVDEWAEAAKRVRK